MRIFNDSRFTIVNYHNFINIIQVIRLLRKSLNIITDTGTIQLTFRIFF